MSSRKKKNTHCSDEDRELFLKSVDVQVKPSSRTKEDAHGKNAELNNPSLKAKRSLEEVSFSELLEKSLSDSEFFRKRDDVSHGKKEQRRAKPREKDMPGSVLDLHACTLEVALARTERFLLQSREKKFQKVLVIHGKGSGVLLQGVRSYLAQHPFVIKIEDAPRHLGGSGAAIVFLRMGP